MIDYDGLPLPADAPALDTCVRLEHPEQGLVELVLDPPHRKLAVLDVPLLRDLDRVLLQLEGMRELRGLVIRGKDPLSFAAGADIDALETTRDPALVERFVRIGQELFGRIAALSQRRGQSVRTVAAIGGPVPGGAYELALSCECILLADDERSRVGLPETQLGILPAWGGSTRLPRRVGVPTALDAILKGRLLKPRPAKSRGFVDRLTPPEYLFDVARDVALGRKLVAKKRRGLMGWLVDRNPLALLLIEKKIETTLAEQTRGRYPAPQEVARISTWAAFRPLEKNLEEEAKAASLLAVGPVCKNLIGIFKRMEGAKKLARHADGSSPARLARGGVLGAGIMGGGVASLLAEKGVATRLFDIAPESLDTAQLEHRAVLKKKRKRRRIQAHEQAAAIDHLDTTTTLNGLGRAEVVIEAVAEKLDVKREVFARLERLVPDDCLLLTNTSSLSVDAIAADLARPERCAGMHFFNPVRRMPLVEIVRGARTSDETLTKVGALALRLGKTPVVVRDVAGFLVNRLLGPYLDEALRLYEAGVSVERIDRAAEEFGMPMGPLALLDEVGLDIASHAATALHAAYGERMSPCRVIEGLLRESRLGKKTGSGFYVHPAGVKPGARHVSPELERVAPPLSTQLAQLSSRELQSRLVMPMLAESLRCLEEEVVASAADLDLATVFGMGFPPFRGGLLTWADHLGGAEVQRRLEALRSERDLANRPGGPERYGSCALLAQRVESGQPLGS